METISSLKKYFLNNCPDGCVARLAWRPRNIKFNEKHAIMLLGKDKCRGLTIGDKCIIAEKHYNSLDSINFIKNYAITTMEGPLYFTQENQYVILAFAKLSGHLKNSSYRIEDDFCALAKIKDSRKKITEDNLQICIFPDESWPDSYASFLFLFWAGGLKKIE